MRFDLIIDGIAHKVELEIGRLMTVNVNGESYRAMVEKDEEGIWVVLGGSKYRIEIDEFYVSVDGRKHKVEVRNLRRGRPSWYYAGKAIQREEEKVTEVPSRTEGMVYPPMPGRVISIKVKEGDPVTVGTPLLVLEAMKMQNEISSPIDGRVVEVRTSEGSLVDVQDLLILIQ